MVSSLWSVALTSGNVVSWFVSGCGQWGVGIGVWAMGVDSEVWSVSVVSGVWSLGVSSGM